MQYKSMSRLDYINRQIYRVPVHSSFLLGFFFIVSTAKFHKTFYQTVTFMY